MACGEFPQFSFCLVAPIFGAEETKNSEIPTKKRKENNKSLLSWQRTKKWVVQHDRKLLDNSWMILSKHHWKNCGLPTPHQQRMSGGPGPHPRLALIRAQSCGRWCLRGLGRELGLVPTQHAWGYPAGIPWRPPMEAKWELGLLPPPVREQAEPPPHQLRPDGVRESR